MTPLIGSGREALAAQPDGAESENPIADPSVRARRKDRIVIWAGRIAFAAVMIGAWQAISGRLVSQFWIASPSSVWHASWELARTGALAGAVGTTLKETLAGFALGASAAVIVGLVLGLGRIAVRVADPYLIALNSVPRVALIPLMIMWFGIGFETRVLFSALLVFFPVFINTIAGARDVDPDLVDVLRVMGATKVSIVRKVVVPASLSWVFAGLRMSVPFALIGAIMAEMFTANQGLGYLISNSADNYDAALTFASLAVTTLIGLVLTGVVGVAERFLLRWQPRP